MNTHSESIPIDSTPTQPAPIPTSIDSKPAPSHPPRAVLPLLCERCGYDLSAAEENAALCPECGEPVENSLPARRVGTAWQRRHGLIPLIITAARTLRHPRRTFRGLRIDRNGFRLQLAINCLIAAFFIADPWVGVLAGDPVRAAHGSGNELIARILGYLAYITVIALILMGLSALEVRGVLFIAKRHGWRLTPTAAWQVCAHASVGWIFCGVLSLLGMATLTALSLRSNIIPKTMVDFSPMFAMRAAWHEVIATILFIGGYLVGMLIFETLVYLGIRQCRYANPPDARPPNA